MHPITVIEIAISVVFVVGAFIIPLLLPLKIRKPSLLIVSVLTTFLMIFFFVRPYWIEFQVSKKTQHLNQYLIEKYSNEGWTITRREGRQYNPYQLEVEFESEKGWTYTYLVVDEEEICQSIWTPPEGELPSEGKHYENSHCE